MQRRLIMVSIFDGLMFFTTLLLYLDRVMRDGFSVVGAFMYVWGISQWIFMGYQNFFLRKSFFILSKKAMKG